MGAWFEVEAAHEFVGTDKLRGQDLFAVLDVLVEEQVDRW